MNIGTFGRRLDDDGESDQKRRLADFDLRAFFVPTSGGGSGIRTHDEVAPITVFKTVAFVHSAIPPYGGQPRHYRHENAL